MPDLDTHMIFDLYFYGLPYGSTEYIHRHIIDQPWQRIFGKQHRKIAHDEKTVLWIERTYGPVAAMVAKSHIALDLTFSGWKRRNGYR